MYQDILVYKESLTLESEQNVECESDVFFAKLVLTAKGCSWLYSKLKAQNMMESQYRD